MRWFNWSRKENDEFRVGVGTLGLDVNASRLRAVSSEPGRPPRTVRPALSSSAASAVTRCVFK